MKSKTYEKDKLKDLEERVELIAESGYKTAAWRLSPANFACFIKAQLLE